jgi:hypothetical protein
MQEFNRKDLEEVIFREFEINSLTPLIISQIGKFITERGYSYKEIAQALVFFTQVDKGEYDPKYGIGIVPFVMERAQLFFEQKRRDKEKQLKSIKTDVPNIILEPKELKRKRKLQRINIEGLED